jgi:hypothetical protein
MNTGRTLASLLGCRGFEFGVGLQNMQGKKSSFLFCSHIAEHAGKNHFFWFYPHIAERAGNKISFLFCSHIAEHAGNKLSFFVLLTQPCGSVRASKDKLMQNHTGHKRQAQKELIRLCLGSCCSDQVYVNPCFSLPSLGKAGC